ATLESVRMLTTFGGELGLSLYTGETEPEALVTDFDLLSYEFPFATFEPQVSIALSAVTNYWVVATPLPDGRVGYIEKSTDQSGIPGATIGNEIYFDTGSGSNWSPEFGNAFAFEVNGSLSVVPEPSTYAAVLGGAAFVGVVIARRRHRREKPVLSKD